MKSTPLSSAWPFWFASCCAWLVLGPLACATGGRAAQRPPREPPPDPQVLIAEGRAFAEEGDLLRAEQYLSAALAAGAEEKIVLPMLVRVCVASNHYRYAIDYIEVALNRDRRNARLRFVAGALYVAIGNHAAAREQLESAAKQLERDPDIQFAVAVFFRDQLTDKVGADKYFRDYLKLAPTGSLSDEARASLMESVQ